MAETTRNQNGGRSDLVVAAAVLLVLAIMILPVATWVLDLLLILNIAVALIILMVTI